MGPDWKPVPLVEVVTLDGMRVVRTGAAVMACYPATDAGMECITAVNLAAAGVKAQHVAQAFGITPQHLSRLRGRARAQGAAGLVARRRGPTGPSRLTPPVRRRIQTLRAQGQTLTAIARQVGVAVSSVSAALAPAPPVQPPLPPSPPWSRTRPPRSCRPRPSRCAMRGPCSCSGG